MTNRYPAIIAYDIHSQQRRSKALRVLKKWRLDGQKSVHECLLTAKEAQHVFNELLHIIDEDSDRLMLAWITPYKPIFNRGTGHSMGFFAQFFDIQ